MIKFLWASRLDEDKRVDLLIEIAEVLEAKGSKVVIDVYGRPVLGSNNYKERFRKLKSINYKGPYDGFNNIPDLESYRGYLYTSNGDGMPNTILEAASNKMAIVATNVGGISELIENGFSGFLIPLESDCLEYVEYLQILADDQNLSKKFSREIYQKFIDQHSWSNFIKRLKLLI